MKKTLAFAGLLTLATQADASLIVYATEADFLGAIGARPHFLNDFGDISYGSLGTSRSYLGSGFGYTISSPGGLVGVAPSGDPAISTDSNLVQLEVAFTSGNVTAVGGIFFLTTFEGESIDGTVTVNLSDSTSETFAAGEFRGFVSGGPLITSLSFQSDIGSDGNYATMDHFYVGVPDGGTTLVLLGGALTGLGALRRKFRA